MKKVTIILRTYNRLEYTIQTLDAIIKNNHDNNFDVLVVDNSSVDGTCQWLEHTKRYNGYYKFNYILLNKNLGDWGGLVWGVRKVQTEYVAQIDNDIICPDNWIINSLKVLEKNNIDTIQCKVFGISSNPLNNYKRVIFNEDDIVKVNRVVACYVTKRSLFSNFDIKKDMKHCLGRMFMSNTMCCIHNEGADGDNSYFNYLKYAGFRGNKNKEYWSHIDKK